MSAEPEKCPKSPATGKHECMRDFGHDTCRCAWCGAEYPNPYSTHPAPLPQEFCIEGDCGNEAYGNSVYCWDHRVKHGLMKTDAAPPSQTIDERAEFEKECAHTVFPIARSLKIESGHASGYGDYLAPDTHIAWHFWRARASLERKK